MSCSALAVYPTFRMEPARVVIQAPAQIARLLRMVRLARIAHPAARVVPPVRLARPAPGLPALLVPARLVLVRLVLLVPARPAPAHLARARAQAPLPEQRTGRLHYTGRVQRLAP